MDTILICGGILLRNKAKPEEWHSGKYGIPITTDFEEYTNGFLDRKVWENSIIQKVSAENNASQMTIYFPSNHPDRYLPVVGKMTYVRLGENRDSIRTSGTLLTSEQQMNILQKGIEPEDIDIIYLDDDYNVLSEPPPLVNERQQFLETLLRFDGVTVTPKNYEQLLGQPPSEKWLQNYEKRQASEPVGMMATESEAIRAAAREMMAAEQERFQQGLRELERFTNMTDIEFQAALDQRFTPQLPELPTAERLESQLWSEAQSARMTPARFEAALKILEEYGPEEGMRKLTKADPKAAAQVKRLLGGASAPEQPPEPPTHPKQQEGTAPPEPNAP